MIHKEKEISKTLPLILLLPLIMSKFIVRFFSDDVRLSERWNLLGTFDERANAENFALSFIGEEYSHIVKHKYHWLRMENGWNNGFDSIEITKKNL